MFARIKHWLTHVHEWEILASGPFEHQFGGAVWKTSTWYELRCKSCGNIKSKRV